MSALVIPPPQTVVSAPPPQGDMCAWANKYAAAGLPPIAIMSNGKRPRHSGWQRATLADTLQHLESEPWLNLGIAVPQGLMVLDIDLKNQGPTTLQAFELQNGALPDTLKAQTPGGGSHYWFSVPAGVEVANAVAFAMGLDVRSAGKGLVVASPSTVDAKPYGWVNWGTPPATVPDWLLSAIRIGEKSAVAAPSGAEPFNIPAGQRNATLFDAAAAMRRKGFTATAIGTALASMNAEACSEPVGNAELESIVNSACSYPPEMPPWQAFSGPVVLPPGASLEKPAGVDSETQGTVVPLDVQGNALEPLPHYVAKWIPQDEVTLLAGHGGGGKSYVALSIAVHVALGRLFGPLLTKQANVLFYSAEDGARVLQSRLARICRAVDIAPGQLEGKLTLLDASDIEPALFRKGELPALGRLAGLTDKHKADLVVIDNASDAFDGDEIKRSEVRGFIRALRARLARPGRAVLLLAHINKQNATSGKSAGSEDYSGSTAWHNSVRSRLSLNPGINGTLTIDHMKANHGPKAEPLRMEWRDGVPVITTGALLDYQAQADRKEAHKQAIIGIVGKLEAQGARVPATQHGSYSTFKTVSMDTAFPKELDKTLFIQLMDELQVAGLVFRKWIKTPDRKQREVYTCTP